MDDCSSKFHGTLPGVTPAAYRRYVSKIALHKSVPSVRPDRERGACKVGLPGVPTCGGCVPKQHVLYCSAHHRTCWHVAARVTKDVAAQEERVLSSCDANSALCCSPFGNHDTFHEKLVQLSHLVPLERKRYSSGLSLGGPFSRDHFRCSQILSELHTRGERTSSDPLEIRFLASTQGGQFKGEPRPTVDLFGAHVRCPYCLYSTGRRCNNWKNDRNTARIIKYTQNSSSAREFVTMKPFESEPWRGLLPHVGFRNDIWIDL